MVVKEKQIEVLLDTVKHYNSGNRSYVNSGCVYQPTENSEGCAIGRLVKNKKLCRKWGSAGVGGIFNELPNDLKKLGVEFLGDLQSLHDTSDFWSETGLSEKGEKYVTAIKIRYDLYF